jgi:hypothetical protein
MRRHAIERANDGAYHVVAIEVARDGFAERALGPPRSETKVSLPTHGSLRDGNNAITIV